jgi:two-component system nitrogen regulation response regulator GlnG
MTESTANNKTMPAAAAKCVLVVDDEPSICWAFQRMLEGSGHRVLAAGSAEEGLEIVKHQIPDLVLLDVRLPHLDGIQALPQFVSATGGPVVVMTAFGDLETAVAAVRGGASDYLIKPFRLEEAQRVCDNALRSGRITDPTITPIRDPKVHDRIVGSSAAIQQAFRQIALVADSELSVLITGETGTGKELVAAAIHQHSRRDKFPYTPIAPVALNRDLIESELFGHVKGAFTGAAQDRSGLFEQSEGGTILLDEIGDLPLGVQVKLLRVLEQGEYARVGDTRVRKCNVRILAATNCDLQQAVAEGRFRSDLFYRLNGLHIHLPPLRERVEDIEPLCHHFLSQLNYPAASDAIDSDLIRQLSNRPWFGNIRELRNALQHAAIVARGRPLTITDFPQPQLGQAAELQSPTAQFDATIATWFAQQSAEPDGDRRIHERLLAKVEPPLIRQVLQYTGGNRAKAADLLGIHRGTLREKIRNYGIDTDADL